MCFCDDAITNETANNTSMTNKANQKTLTPTNNGPFPYYWAVVTVGTGYKSEVYLNGTLIDKVDTFTNYTTKKKAVDLLKDGKNEITVNVTDVSDATKQYFKQELSFDIMGTPLDKEFRFDDPALKEIISINFKDADLKKGTYNYSFNLKK